MWVGHWAHTHTHTYLHHPPTLLISYYRGKSLQDTSCSLSEVYSEWEDGLCLRIFQVFENISRQWKTLGKNGVPTKSSPPSPTIDSTPPPQSPNLSCIRGGGGGGGGGGFQRSKRDCGIRAPPWGATTTGVDLAPGVTPRTPGSYHGIWEGMWHWFWTALYCT